MCFKTITVAAQQQYLVCVLTDYAFSVMKSPTLTAVVNDRNKTLYLPVS